MQKLIEIKNYRDDAEKLQLEGIYSQVDIENLQATGQMLVDSDTLAFIYILENEHEFIYVSLPSVLWPSLKRVMTGELMVVLKLADKEIELTNIIEELQYLISNIEGNANYGDEMVRKVEEIFLQKHKS